MTNEIVLSTIENQGKDVKNAPFWKECYHKDEVSDEMLKSGKQWYEYHIKFENTVPVQLTKTNKLRKPLITK